MNKRKRLNRSDFDFIELVPCTCLKSPCECDLNDPDAGKRTYELSVGDEFAAIRKNFRERQAKALSKKD